MELSQIKAYLDSPNPQNRMKAIVELRNHTPSVVVPLLKQRMYDKEFVIRSFVAMGLGYKRTDEGFQSLLDLIENDGDPNVKAEAANSLANYGEKAIPHLVELFRDELGQIYEIKGTKMVRFERKGQMIPNLYVYVDSTRMPESLAYGLPDD